MGIESSYVDISVSFSLVQLFYKFVGDWVSSLQLKGLAKACLGHLISKLSHCRQSYSSWCLDGVPRSTCVASYTAMYASIRELYRAAWVESPDGLQDVGTGIHWYQLASSSHFAVVPHLHETKYASLFSVWIAAGNSAEPDSHSYIATVHLRCLMCEA